MLSDIITVISCFIQTPPANNAKLFLTNYLRSSFRERKIFALRFFLLSVDFTWKLQNVFSRIRREKIHLRIFRKWRDTSPALFRGCSSFRIVNFMEFFCFLHQSCILLKSIFCWIILQLKSWRVIVLKCDIRWHFFNLDASHLPNHLYN